MIFTHKYCLVKENTSIHKDFLYLYLFIFVCAFVHVRLRFSCHSQAVLGVYFEWEYTSQIAHLPPTLTLKFHWCCIQFRPPQNPHKTENMYFPELFLRSFNVAKTNGFLQQLTGSYVKNNFYVALH